MRPVGSGGADGLSALPRKPSFASPSPHQSTSNVPTSFFLARELDLDSRSDVPAFEEPRPPRVCTLEEAIGEAAGLGDTPAIDEDTRRRRSTIRAAVEKIGRESSTAAQRLSAAHEPLTPLLAGSPGDISLPSSPKSTSSRSLQNAELGSISDDIGSQAVASSGDEEEHHPDVSESAPQLIMPSIKMPSRRPFTSKGRELGKLKIMVAGTKGSGKTSLIKSIVQTCEDIVHVDPAGSSSTTPAASTLLGRQPSSSDASTEIYASTKSYPAWWSELDESRVLRRRKSLGDMVLERNICFVDTAPGQTAHHLMHYMEHQLQLAIQAATTAGTDFVNLLSGRGASQVDLVLFLVTKDTLYSDIDNIRLLSELSNVVPLIAKSDLLGDESLASMKEDISTRLTSSTSRPLGFPWTADTEAESQPPFAVSAAVSPDHDTMDASLLMSPEYVQPLVTSELPLLVRKVFDRDTITYLRHSAAKRLVAWRKRHPLPLAVHSPSRSSSPRPSTLGSPVLSSVSASGVLVPHASDISLTTSNSYTLARLADHTQHEERLAQVRLAKWATDLHQSLNRERERYERLARGERAMWLVERMGEEVRDGRVQASDRSIIKQHNRLGDFELPTYAHPAFPMNDPIGLLKWNDELRTRGWVALQVFGSFGVIGGLALWLARTWGFSSGQSVSEHVSGFHWR